MREFTIRIRFVCHCLGGEKQPGGRFVFSRGPSGQVLFLSSWHRANMRFAAKLLGRHHGEVDKIHWDIHVDGQPQPNSWFKRYYRSSGDRQRYAIHEAFAPGHIVGINCLVPASISEEDLWQLFQKAGQYRGISPWKPGEYGFYEVVSIRPRRVARPPEENELLSAEILPVAQTGLREA